MDESIIEKLNQEKKVHAETKKELEIALKEKNELLNKIEIVLANFSILFCNSFFSFRAISSSFLVLACTLFS